MAGFSRSSSMWALAAAPIDRVLELWSGLATTPRASCIRRRARLSRNMAGGFRAIRNHRHTAGIGRSTARRSRPSLSASAAILEATKRVLARHRGIEASRHAEGQAELWKSGALLPEHRDLHAGADGPRGDDLHTDDAAMQRLPGRGVAARGDCVAMPSPRP
jgi:A/G-specific adenine glycosylase